VSKSQCTRSFNETLRDWAVNLSQWTDTRRYFYDSYTLDNSGRDSMRESTGSRRPPPASALTCFKASMIQVPIGGGGSLYFFADSLYSK